MIKLTLVALGRNSRARDNQISVLSPMEAPKTFLIRRRSSESTFY